MSLEVRQTTTSGSSRVFYELLLDGLCVETRTLDGDDKGDAALLIEAQLAINDALVAARRDSENRVRLYSASSATVEMRDRYAETQAMVLAFAQVVFPNVEFSQQGLYGVPYPIMSRSERERIQALGDRLRGLQDGPS